MATHTQPIHQVNAHLVPALCFADYPGTEGTYNDSLIVSRYVGRVLRNAMSISEARAQLWTYPHREAKLAAFDRWLLDSLSNCAERAAPYRA